MLTAFLLLLLRFFVFNLWHFNDDVSLWVHLVWDFLSFLGLYVYFFPQVREGFVIISSNRFSIPHSLFSSLHPMWMVVCLMLSQRPPYTILTFWISTCCYSDWGFLLPYLLDWSSDPLLYLLLIPSMHYFSYCIHHFWLVLFVFYLFIKVLSSSTLPLSSLSILITSVLNSASGILLVSLLFFSGLCSSLSFGPCFLVSPF